MINSLGASIFDKFGVLTKPEVLANSGVSRNSETSNNS